LTGGVDSYLEAETLEWLDENRQLMSARNRSGFPPGEAAGFCLLGSSDWAGRMGLAPLGRIAAVNIAVEQNTMKGQGICIGDGLSSAIASATAGLKLPEQRINTIYCDLNGERYRVEEYTFAALRNYAAFVSVHDTVHPADCWGDVGASSGPLYACLAVASGQRGYAKGPRALLFASSECGYRCAALLELPVKLPRE
jgi:3-oxoacyl-[acyl-carrier-protein] synthase-1